MNQIFLIGSGRSSNYLINFLLNEAESNDFELVIGDINLELAESKLDGHKSGRAILFDIQNESVASKHIEEADLVISMLPSHLHQIVAGICLEKEKSLLTASYNTPELKEMDQKVKERLFLSGLN